MNNFSKFLRRTAAIAAVVLLSASCGSSEPTTPPSYEAAIKEGQAAAQALVTEGASAMSIALVDANHVIWSQGLGLADRAKGEPPSTTTMFGVGSVNKLFTAVAVMKLVDRGVIELDKPLVTYMPAFRMADPGYANITVRMLLNHSAGFPGTDYRGLILRSPAPRYLGQVLETLETSTLKAPPGFMSVYCNDCFTLAAGLVEATAGKSYPQFVQDEILNPLGMANTRFPLSTFPAGSYAQSYANGAPKPQEFVNTLGSGALYSTAEDLGRFAMMFLGAGAVGPTRILSASSVAEMSVDQTLRSFNPAHNASFAYGLGWDTVSDPGLEAAGFDGWVKGGDTNDYGATFVVSRRAQLGVVVLTAGSGSARALAVAERVLLRALVEKGALESIPQALPAVAPPPAPVPEGLLASVTGEYAIGNLVARLQATVDGALQVALLNDAGWTPSGAPLVYRSDGWFTSDQDPLRGFKVVDVDLLGQPAQYIVTRAPGSADKQYLAESVFAQRVRRKPGELSAAWQGRLSSTWLVVNEQPDELTWNGMDPRLRLATMPSLKGLIGVRALVDLPPPAGQPDTRFRILDPSASDSVATMMLVIPQLNGRDLENLTIEPRDGAEWARLGSYVHRPLATVRVLTNGMPEVVTIGPEGYAEWRAVMSQQASLPISITTTGAWQLYDPTFTSVANGTGPATVSVPAGSGLAYLTLFGEPGQSVLLAVP